MDMLLPSASSVLTLCNFSKVTKHSGDSWGFFTTLGPGNCSSDTQTPCPEGTSAEDDAVEDGSILHSLLPSILSVYYLVLKGLGL